MSVTKQSRFIDRFVKYIDEVVTPLIDNGYLELQPLHNEAYITRAALGVLANIDDESTAPDTPGKDTRIIDAVNNLRLVSTFFSTAKQQPITGKDMEASTPVAPPATFAMHIVTEEHPHDLIGTLVITHKRRWYWPFYAVTTYKYIAY